MIYMGNNEVVGPFGIGTVFGSQTTPLPLIRAGLAFKATGHRPVVRHVATSGAKAPGSDGSWEGLAMFAKYKFADPRLEAVRQKSERHPAVGRNSGAKIVLAYGGGKL